MPEELKNKGFGFLPILLIAAVIGTASIIGFNTFSPTNNSSDVLAATSGTTILDCIKNPAAPACASSYQTVKVNTKFYQNVNDTKPPWWRPITRERGNDICDTEPGSEACNKWIAFKNYCDEFGEKNKDKECQTYLATKGIYYENAVTAWENFCKSALGKYDQRCIDNGMYCSSNPSDAVCNPKVTPTPKPAPQGDGDSDEDGNSSTIVYRVREKCNSSEVRVSVDKNGNEICILKTLPSTCPANQKKIMDVNSGLLSCGTGCPSSSPKIISTNADGTLVCGRSDSSVIQYKVREKCSSDEIRLGSDRLGNEICQLRGAQSSSCPAGQKKVLNIYAGSLSCGTGCPASSPRLISTNTDGTLVCGRVEGVACSVGFHYENRDGTYVCIRNSVTPTPVPTPTPTLTPVGTGSTTYEISGNCQPNSTFVAVAANGKTICRLNDGLILVDGTCPAGYDGLENFSRIEGKNVCRKLTLKFCEYYSKYDSQGGIEIWKKLRENCADKTSSNNTDERVYGYQCSYRFPSAYNLAVPTACKWNDWRRKKIYVQCTYQGRVIYSSQIISCDIPRNVYDRLTTGM